MKLTKYTLFFGLLFSFVGMSQISITNVHLPSAGESFIVSQVADLQIDFATTGENHQWDFSNLSYASQTTRVHNTMSGLPLLVNVSFGPLASSNYRASYHAPYTDLPIDQLGTLLPIQLSDVNQFTRKTAQRLTLVGYSASINGQGVPMKSDTIETKYILPLNYGDSFTSRGYTQLDLSAFSIDARWVQIRRRTTVVDGWGEITTPFGTFDALRVKHRIVETDSIEYSGFAFGIAIPVMNEYEWLSDDEKIPVLKITTSEVGGNETVIGVEYRDFDHVGLATTDASSFMMYPNPVDEELVLSAVEGHKNVRIYHINGMMVNEFSFDGAMHTITTSDLRSGMYYLQLEKEGVVTTKSFVKK